MSSSISRFDVIPDAMPRPSMLKSSAMTLPLNRSTVVFCRRRTEYVCSAGMLRALSCAGVTQEQPHALRHSPMDDVAPEIYPPSFAQQVQCENESSRKTVDQNTNAAPISATGYSAAGTLSAQSKHALPERARPLRGIGPACSRFRMRKEGRDGAQEPEDMPKVRRFTAGRCGILHQLRHEDRGSFRAKRHVCKVRGSAGE